tara:strand:- start:1116 stop:1481 length:366 start_codon:yes stop_codon:yes gene_type:complete
MTCLSLKSDFFFFPKSGQITEKDSYWVIKSPDFPEYHWGNYIFFKEELRDWSAKRLSQVFSDEFSDVCGIAHQAFVCPATTRQAQFDLDLGDLDLDRTIVLTLSGPPALEQECCPHPSKST